MPPSLSPDSFRAEEHFVQYYHFDRSEQIYRFPAYDSEEVITVTRDTFRVSPIYQAGYRNHQGVYCIATCTMNDPNGVDLQVSFPIVNASEASTLGHRGVEIEPQNTNSSGTLTSDSLNAAISTMRNQAQNTLRDSMWSVFNTIPITQEGIGQTRISNSSQTTNIDTVKYREWKARQKEKTS